MDNITDAISKKELLLSHFTMENLHEAVFWIESNQRIFQVNDMACKLSGYTREELTGMRVTDINPSSVVIDWPAFWQRLKHEKKIVFEAQHRHKTGYLYDVEITGNFIEMDGQEFSCSIVRDIRKRKKEEQILLAVSEATSALTGADYFRELTKFITETLNVRYSMVVACSEDQQTKLHMLSYVDRKEVLENIEYDTKGTPCEIVMQGKEFFCADKLDEVFPREKGKKSWVAVPIYSPSTGKVIGNIAAFDRIPMVKEDNQLAILRIFAARAGAEIDRLKAEEKLKAANTKLEILLKESEERFRDLFEEAPIAYVHEGLDSKFIKANRAALRILGVKPEEVPFMYGKTLAPDTPDAQRRMKEAFESVGRGTDTSGVVLELMRKDNGNQPIQVAIDHGHCFCRVHALQQVGKTGQVGEYKTAMLALTTQLQRFGVGHQMVHKIRGNITRKGLLDPALAALRADMPHHARQHKSQHQRQSWNNRVQQQSIS